MKWAVWLVVMLLAAGLLEGCQHAAARRSLDEAGQPVPPKSAGLPFRDIEGSVHGFPAMRDLQGQPLADGEFIQRATDGRIRIEMRFDFGRDRQIEEVAEFREQPALVQKTWSWRETIGGKLQREFSVDFVSGKASAQKREEGRSRDWSEQLDLTPGATFAGVGFTLAIRTLRERLLRGEKIELKTIGFTPKPRVVSVEITHEGVDEMTMAGRVVRGDCFLIHPKIPAIARLIIKAPDARLWLVNPEPAGFLRSEGPLLEPGDPIVRVDVLPGDRSGPAKRLPR